MSGGRVLGVLPFPKILVISSDALARAGLRSLLSTQPVADVELGQPAQVAQAAVQLQPNLIIIEAGESANLCLTILPRLIRLAPVIVIFRRSDRAAATSAAGYGGVASVLTRDVVTARVLNDAVNAAVRKQAVGAQDTYGLVPGTGDTRAFASAAGARFGLSRREVQVMEQMAMGTRNADIARLLNVQEKTVKNHINRIFAKLEVETRAQAIVRWLGQNVRMSRTTSA